MYLCDFHREQAWERWLSANHNGLHLQKNDVLKLLRNVTHANTEEEYENCKQMLQLWHAISLQLHVNKMLQNFILKY